MGRNGLAGALAPTAVLLWAAGCATPVVAQQIAMASYRIAPQTLGSALKQFARDSGAQILFSEEDVLGKVTRGIIGRFTRSDALRRLVGQTKLTVSEAGQNVFVIRKPGGASLPSPVRTAPAPSVIARTADPARAVVERRPPPTSADRLGATLEQSRGEPDREAATVEIVVTGIRRSLERAAEIKRDAVQVVDSIVAQEIGKFPDPTTAAALQRVPGVQVSVDRQNELSGVRIRGLPDVLTMVNGREVFTANDRSFSLQDLPAEALARVDVYKTQSADQIEGGVAGSIDLRLNKPFAFHDPTIVLSARGNYGENVDRATPQFGGLATDRWNTGAGEFGILVNGTWSRNRTVRTQTTLTDRRNSGAAPIGRSGYFLPAILQTLSNLGTFTRWQANGAIEWQASPTIEVYADGLATSLTTTVSTAEFNIQPFTTSTIASDIVATDNCFRVRSTVAGQNPAISTDAAGTSALQPFTTPTLCDVGRVSFMNAVSNQTSGSRDIAQTTTLAAGGLRYRDDRFSGTLDLSYQAARQNDIVVRTAVGQRLPSVTLETHLEGGGDITVPGDYLTRRTGLSLRNQLVQNFFYNRGALLQTRADGEVQFAGFVRKLQFGFRFADRSGRLRSVASSTPIPFGNLGTSTEISAKLASDTGLPNAFLALGPEAPRLNGGSRYLAPNPDFLRSEVGRDMLRATYSLPPGSPPYDPTRQFDATERAYAGYGQIAYRFDLPDGAFLDGVVGARFTRTDCEIGTFRQIDAVNQLVSVSASDSDVLPNATARLQLHNGMQARVSYYKAIRRPEFSLLNPANTLTSSNNPAVLGTGAAGNPALRPQKSDSVDATLEIYQQGGYLAITGYHRKLINRVINSSSQETIGGVTYIVARPRNVGKAALQGVEVSGQYFFDFLTGLLGGFGIQGTFTFAASKVGGNDPLVGSPLQGVSRYNYTAGLLYERARLSGRLIYTYRSRYYASDLTGDIQVRGIDAARIGDVFLPTLLEYVRPAGRLDFSIGYDLTSRLRIDVGGVNITGTPTRTYRGEKFFNGSYFADETMLTAGVRVRL